VEPIYSCSDAVFVVGIVPGAVVEVLVNGALKAQNFSAGTALGFHLGTPFGGGEVVEATQTIDAATSDKSNAAPVADFTETFSQGLPRPQIYIAPFFECGAAIGMANFLGGATLFFEGSASPNDLGSRQNDGNPRSGGIVTARPFELGEMLTGHYEFCQLPSDDAEAHPVVPEPDEIPPPIVEEPYEGMRTVFVSNLLHGARVTVFVNGQERMTVYQSGIAAHIPISPPLAVGDSVTAQQALCSESDPSSDVRVRPCASLPAPRIRRPLPGDQFVVVTHAVPGARIQVYDEQGIEIGDGAGDRVVLDRPLVPVERVRVVQEVGGCRSQMAYEIHVDCGPNTTTRVHSRWVASAIRRLRCERYAAWFLCW
jgi:hypothetical protein